MDITGLTTLAGLASERARLGIEWISLILNDADGQHRVRASGVLAIGGIVYGFGDDFASAFAQLFETAERAIAQHIVEPRVDLWTENGVTHEQIGDDDDHRILIMRCDERCNYIHPSGREPQGTIITCAKCEALRAAVQRG